MKKAVIVLPTYNESGNIETLVEKIFDATNDESNWDVHVLVVDSSSPDKTGDLVKKLQKKFKNLHLLVTKKEGLGRAYYNGFSYALDKLNPFIIGEMDADLSHDPANLPKFLREVEKGSDFVLGTRYAKGGSIPKNWGVHRKILSIFGNLIVRLGFMNLKITDWTGGYRMIKSWIIRSSLDHIKNQTGYIFQIALLDHAIQQKAIIAEVPIQFKDRVAGESKINFTGYAFRVFLYIFNHSSFVKFVIVGGIGFILDFALSHIFIDRLHWPLALATLLSTESAVISNFLLNNFWSFSHKQLEAGKRSYLFGFIKFNLVSSGSVLIQTLGMHFLGDIFGRKLWYIYKVLLIVFVVIPYSYILYNKLIWKDKK